MLKILVVCHDAGAANILAALVKKYRRDFKWVSYISGPARGIFLKQGIITCSCSGKLGLKDASKILGRENPDLVLAGTGWQTRFYLNFIKAAKRNKIKTASFLDHWCNYRERFGFPGNWKNNLPDFVFTGDKWSYALALKEGFPKGILLRVENPYFEELIRQAGNKYQAQNKKGGTLKILYLSGPIYDHALKLFRNPHFWGYTEYSVMKDLLKIMKLIKGRRLSELKVRLHPAEKIDKYSSIINSPDFACLKGRVSVSNDLKNPLIKACSWADMVIGSESMALVIALIVGRNTISYLPGAKRKYCLPQKQIKRIHSLAKLKDLITDTRSCRVKKNHILATGKLFKAALEKIKDSRG